MQKTVQIVHFIYSQRPDFQLVGKARVGEHFHLSEDCGEVGWSLGFGLWVFWFVVALTILVFGARHSLFGMAGSISWLDTWSLAFGL